MIPNTLSMIPNTLFRQHASGIDVSGLVKLLLSRGRERLNRTLSRSSAVLSRRNRYSSPRPDRI